jgi:hypothetical protein
MAEPNDVLECQLLCKRLNQMQLGPMGLTSYALSDENAPFEYILLRRLEAGQPHPVFL